MGARGTRKAKRTMAFMDFSSLVRPNMVSELSSHSGYLASGYALRMFIENIVAD